MKKSTTYKEVAEMLVEELKLTNYENEIENEKSRDEDFVNINHIVNKINKSLSKIIKVKGRIKY